MPEIPQADWKRIDADALEEILDKTMDERKMSKFQGEIMDLLMSHVRDGSLIAYLKPNGEIAYQYNWEMKR